MSKMLEGLKNATNYTLTENGALTHRTTRSDLLDMFAFGGAYRSRSDEDVILLFKNAYEENPLYAVRCLFYLRDVRGGQGERRFFRVCLRWLADTDYKVGRQIIPLVPEFGRWDDLYEFVGTDLEGEAFAFMKSQLLLDMQSAQNGNAVSLLGKWLKSCNASSYKTKQLGNKTRQAFGMTQRQYRKTLSVLRTQINIVEKLMSENRWDEIEFDKIPSKAGLVYRNAFARRDMIAKKYESFAKDKTTKVNAKTLYPYEVVAQAIHFNEWRDSKTNRAMIEKYWENLADYFANQSFNGLAVVDTSASMTWSGTAAKPIDVAVSLGLYCAEKAGGPFAGHYISFSSRPQLIRVEGVDFVDKVKRIVATNLCQNTDIERTFDLLLNTAISNRLSQEDLPQNIIVISDMEFDRGTAGYLSRDRGATLLESIAQRWAAAGYEMPHLIFWNVDARQNNIPMLGNGRISYVSGFSPSIFQTIMSGKTGYELMMETLNSERYAGITIA